ncbi:MAG: 16S rRNA (cytosine(967)-C(5))-methyltransferase RsmB [Erysipelotrichaceae bacterium]|nr:16S rRNA (cytosine(967)-C(5))-methyltransferase RsmB [Erysipelotrichaceae bacterium]
MERQLALEILLKYQNNHSYLNITLNHYFQQYPLTQTQKNFITRVVYGTVTYQLYLDFIIKQNITGRIKSFERMLLMMSLYQMIYMDAIPQYAIINEAVNLAKQKGKRTANFINAALRKLTHYQLSFDGLDDIERLSIETSHPLWLVKLYMKQYGKETAIEILNANNTIPKQSARVNTLLTTVDNILQIEGFSSCAISMDGVYYDGAIVNTDVYKQGLITIQDESSQLVARLLHPHKEDYVLDMCASPGGKTTHLAALMNNQGVIEAYDLYEHKIKLIDQLCQRLHITNIHTHCYDSTKLLEIYHEETFDKILLDAPCSGLGVIKRKPEIKYHDSHNLDELQEIQQKLLENAYPILKKGGNMVYSTCTLNKKENEKQIQAFLSRHPDMKIKEERTILPTISDGFYMCLLEKELK